MNTAPLTGVSRRVPVRLVTVDSGGTLVEVTEHIGCESANAQVLQVSGTCQPHVGIHVYLQRHPHSFPPSLWAPQENSSFLTPKTHEGSHSTNFLCSHLLSPGSSGSCVTPNAPNLGTSTVSVASADELPRES